jgi:AraC-like DNA-binding protein
MAVLAGPGRMAFPDAGAAPAAALWPVVDCAGEDDVLFPAGRWDRTLDEFELAVTLNGGEWLVLGARRVLLGPGDALYLRPGQRHVLEHDGRTRSHRIFVRHHWVRLGAAPGCGGADEAADPLDWPTVLEAGAHSEDLVRHMRDLLSCLWEARGPWRWECSVALLAAACAFARSAAPGGGPALAAPREVPAVRAARAFIERELSAPPQDLVARAARAAGVSASHLNRLFHRTYGLSPRAWTEQLRLARACYALTHLAADVRTAAARAGMADVRHFRRWFRRHMGVPPAAYRAAGSGCAASPGVRLPQPAGCGRPYPVNVHLLAGEAAPRASGTGSPARPGRDT